MESDELTWVDSVPVRPARRKVITVSEYEWARTTAADGEPARLEVHFWINSTELMAVLIEEPIVACGGSIKHATAPVQPCVRLRGRSYLLVVEAAAPDSST